MDAIYDGPLSLPEIDNGTNSESIEASIMKYMLLIYADENAWTETEREACYAESTQLTQTLHAKGQYLGASPL